MLSIDAINAIAEQDRKEKERKRKAIVARINEQQRRRREAAERAEVQARVEAQNKLREEVKRYFMVSNGWATEADFSDAWKKDKLAMIRDYQQSLHTLPRMF
jgi:methionyl-tRNA synthetase